VAARSLQRGRRWRSFRGLTSSGIAAHGSLRSPFAVRCPRVSLTPFAPARSNEVARCARDLAARVSLRSPFGLAARVSFASLTPARSFRDARFARVSHPTRFGNA